MKPVFLSRTKQQLLRARVSFLTPLSSSPSSSPSPLQFIPFSSSPYPLSSPLCSCHLLARGNMIIHSSLSMGSLHFLIFYSYILTLFSQVIIPIAPYTLAPSESIIDGQTLISQGAKFELGFFSPSNSTKRYLGMWYKTIPVRTIVWVANRDSPLYDTSGVLKIGTSGNIVIVNKSESVVWSSNSSKAVENPILEFLESGNIVLRDVKDRDSGSYLWQSFDYPGDTLLPGMTLGWNLKTGFSRYLTSWRNFDDPSNGGFTLGIDLATYLEKSLYKGSKKYYRTGPWNGIRFSGAPSLKDNTIFTYQVIHNAEEIYYTFHLVNQSVILRGLLTQTSTDQAQYQLFTWVSNSNSWFLLVGVPTNRCDYYAPCGAYGSCDQTNVVICNCLKGFKPKSPQNLSGTDWSLGCEREASVNCSKGEGFVKYTGVKLPDTAGAWADTSMNLEECRVKCLINCSCMAYTNSDIRGGGSGCIMWLNNLIDIRQLPNDGQDIYIRMAASALDSKANSTTKERLIMIVSIPFVVGIIVLGFGSWCIWKKRYSKGGYENDDDLELPLYDLVTITTATNNFSEENKLGQGGFGPVYKGKLEGEQEIAVKRLSKHSTQGVEEFKNEVILISKLQHKNLVRILGCCIQGKEKMLVYEYMQNGSLNSSIFDETKRRLLDWKKRFDIILGIARGLLYIHHDSRLMIIHRDLKASNILLDKEMVPKISDFGLARMFGGDQIEANTKRVVGTYGYMSPEYAVDGHFSMKSDVFSFGVIVLEIISGYKNWSFRHPDHDHNLLGHAWRLWNQERSIELVDASMSSSCFTEDILRCIHIGLLCVQKDTKQRPTMSSVVLMLGSETVVLPHPQLPGFFIERCTPTPEGTSYNDKESCASNDATITVLEAR